MNPANNHVGFPIARNTNGNLINANNAPKGIVYYCPFCGIEMFKKTSHRGTDFFAKKPGVQHTHSICQQIEQKGKYHSFEASESPSSLIATLCHVPIPSGPRGDGGGPHTPPTNPLEPLNPTNAVATPFRSLKSVYEYGFFDSNPFEKCGDYYVSDYYIHYTWAHHFFNVTNYKLECRIIHARFHSYDRINQKLYFFIFHRKLKRNIFFALHFSQRSLFDEVLKQLFGIQKAESTQKTETFKKDALIASTNWKYDSVNDCYTTRILNAKQLYIIPK